jgi:hypothetical protein
MGNTIVQGDLQTSTSGITLTAQIAAALADAGLGTNAGKLKRVDTSAWEVARRSNGAITAVADAGGGKVTITSAGHQQTNGTEVVIAGTTDYNGTFTISDVTADTFDITETFTSSQTGTFTAENIYHSTDQKGGKWGPIYRRYFQGVTGGTNIVMLSGFHAAKRMIGQGGHCIDTATGSTLTMPTYFGSVSDCGLNDNGTDLILIVGTGFDDANDTYDTFVDYYEP